MYMYHSTLDILESCNLLLLEKAIEKCVVRRQSLIDYRQEMDHNGSSVSRATLYACRIITSARGINDHLAA